MSIVLLLVLFGLLIQLNFLFCLMSCILNRTKHPCLNYITLPQITGSDYVLLPCGKCPNCLKRKSNELVVRMQRQLFGRKVHLLTFTYNNDKCPIYVRKTFFDRDTGEVLRVVSGFDDFFRKRFFASAPYTWRYNKHHVRVKRYAPLYLEDGDCLVEAYQSIDYKHMKDLIKRVRSRFDLSDYICVPEYGGAGFRPHYHLVAVGFSQSAIDSLVSDWQSKFGNVDVRVVDSSDSAQLSKVANYISKYTSKGSFDCPYIFSGNCLKPRRSVSVGFGKGSKEDFDRLVAQVCRFDLYGEYDYKNVVPDGFSLDAFESVRKYSINGYSYPFPCYLIRKIFFNKIKRYDEKTNSFKSAIVASPLQKAFTTALFLRTAQRVERELQSVGRLVQDSGFFSSFIPKECEQPYKDSIVADFVRQIECDSIY